MQSNFSFGIPWLESIGYSSSTIVNPTHIRQPQPFGQGNSFYQNCQITINNHSPLPTKSVKKRRLAIISDSEDSD